MENKNTTNYAEVNKSYERRRNRAKNFYRCAVGVQQISRNPIKLIPILILTVAFIITLFKSNGFVTQSMENPLINFVVYMASEYIEYATIYKAFLFLIIGVISMFYLVLVFGVLCLLGIPRKAREIESDIKAALISKGQDYYKRPFLISSTPIKHSGVVEHAFYSRWISLEKWREFEPEILTALNAHRVEEYRYGGINGRNKRIIILCVGSGANPADRGILNDDEL